MRYRSISILALLGFFHFQNAVHAATLAYKNADYGFSLKYSSQFSLYDKFDGKVFDENAFRLNQGIVLVSLIYNGSDYANTNLLGAGITVGKINPPKELGCKTNFTEKTSGNLIFYRGTGAERTGSIFIKYGYYEIQTAKGCFMIEMAIKADESSAKKPLSDEDREALKNLMAETASSFTTL